MRDGALNLVDQNQTKTKQVMKYFENTFYL